MALKLRRVGIVETKLSGLVGQLTSVNSGEPQIQ